MKFGKKADAAREALRERLAEHQAVHERIAKNKQAKERAEAAIREAGPALARAQEALDAAIKDHVAATTDAYVNDTAPPADKAVRDARAALAPLQDREKIARAALQDLESRDGEFQSEALHAGYRLQDAMADAIAEPVARLARETEEMQRRLIARMAALQHLQERNLLRVPVNLPFFRLADIQRAISPKYWSVAEEFKALPMIDFLKQLENDPDAEFPEI